MPEGLVSTPESRASVPDAGDPAARTDGTPPRWALDALSVLTAGCPSEKTACAITAFGNLQKDGCQGAVGPMDGRALAQSSLMAPLMAPLTAPSRPARPAQPHLVPPHAVPRRRPGTRAGRIALLHALAHIEFNAIDLAFDMALRFCGAIGAAGLDQRRFVADWFAVGHDEARHFTMLNERLGALGAAYGESPAHDGLWHAAEQTSDDALARLAIAPMVLEARGLDVTPGMIEKLSAAGDHDSADILRVILREEVDHVRKGHQWFDALCAARALDPRAHFRALVSERFAGRLKPPFNEDARREAGLMPDFYSGL